MRSDPVTERRARQRPYTSPAITRLGTVESRTAGNGGGDKDGAIGYRHENIRRDLHAEVTVPARFRKPTDER
jgi:hypothetical protein